MAETAGRDILHVGLHKTGSTYLQRQIFPRLEDVVYNGPGLWEDWAKALDRQLRFWSPLYIDCAAWRAELERVRRERGGKRLLYSQESLVGRLLDGYRDHAYLADMLQAIFPAAKVFLVYRRQDDWAESAYRQTLHLGMSVPVADFLNLRKGRFRDLERPAYIVPSINVNQLDWTRIVESYQRRFGRENVLALPYEMMTRALPSFLDRFYAFSGIAPYHPERIVHENRGYSLVAARLAYLVNRFVPGREGKKRLRGFLQERLDRVGYRPGHLIDSELRLRILEQYRDANRRLAALTGCDLAAYGYYGEDR